MKKVWLTITAMMIIAGTIMVGYFVVGYPKSINFIDVE
jgi:hypothetical protein